MDSIVCHNVEKVEITGNDSVHPDGHDRPTPTRYIRIHKEDGTTTEIDLYGTKEQENIPVED